MVWFPASTSRKHGASACCCASVGWHVASIIANSSSPDNAYADTMLVRRQNYNTNDRCTTSNGAMPDGKDTAIALRTRKEHKLQRGKRLMCVWWSQLRLDATQLPRM